MRRRLPPEESVEYPQSALRIPAKYLPLFDNRLPDGTPIRYKCFFGGRGSAKSWSMARALVAKAYTEKHLILCTREFQNTIADSVKRVIERQISDLGLDAWFHITDNSIKCRLTGSEFIFKGLRRDIQGIRSLEGITICFVEEGHWVTKDSWLILDPTIRAPGSQIWVAYNPVDEDDPTHQMFAIHPPDDAVVIQTSWADNPYFPEELDRLRRRMLREDPEAYDWVWQGECRKISEATIFRGHYIIEGFEEPEVVDRYFYGVDWGFSNDPLFATRSYIHDEELYITHEFYGIGVEIDDIPTVLVGGVSDRTGVAYPGIPGIADWPIKADNARPETISYVSRKGLNIEAAEKWSGSVEDGISHLKGFRKIHIHERCVNMAAEARLYSYKVDKKTGDVLPTIEDKNNHGWDSVRYALDGYIQARGGMGVWSRL